MTPCSLRRRSDSRGVRAGAPRTALVDIGALPSKDELCPLFQVCTKYERRFRAFMAGVMKSATSEGTLAMGALEGAGSGAGGEAGP